MSEAHKLLTAPALVVLLLLSACDDSGQPEAQKPDIEVTLPSDYYTAPPAPQAPPTPPKPGVLVTPDRFDMGRAEIGASVITRTIPIGVGGETPVKIFGIERSGSEALSISTDCPDQLVPGDNCLLLLEFIPQETGELESSVLIATDTGLATINVTGEAFRSQTVEDLQADLAPDLPLPVPPTVVSPYQTDNYRQALAMLEARRTLGPSFSGLGDDTFAVMPPSYRMSDPDYLRENTPSAETSFSVDRTNILTITRMQWGVLDREIQSALPGLVIVRVDEDVFGTDGLVKILEKGDAYVGRYEPLEKVGDDRLNICFFRIIRLADGAHVYNDDECFAYATDAMGRVGLVGEVDSRMWEKYGSAFLTASISALASYGTSQFDNGNDDVQNSSEALSDQLGKITASMIEQNLDLSPIITVAGGERVGIQLLRDLYIRRPEPLKE
jgi:type IV secretion system protein VirB10